MSTHNICISRKIRKILCGYSLLSVAMVIAIKLAHCNKHLLTWESRDITIMVLLLFLTQYSVYCYINLLLLLLSIIFMSV